MIGAQAAGLAPVLYDPTGVFAEADCMRIADLSELLDWVIRGNHEHKH